MTQDVHPLILDPWQALVDARQELKRVRQLEHMSGKSIVQIQEMQQRYRGLAIQLDAIEGRLWDELDTLRRELSKSDYEAKLEEIWPKYERAHGTIASMRDEFEEMDLSEIDTSFHRWE